MSLVLRTDDRLSRLMSGLGIVTIFLLGPLLISAPFAIAMALALPGHARDEASEVFGYAYQLGLWPAAITGFTAALLWRDLRGGTRFTLACGATGFVSSASTGLVLAALESGWAWSNLAVAPYSGGIGLIAALFCALASVEWRQERPDVRLGRRGLAVASAILLIAALVGGLKLAANRQIDNFTTALSPGQCRSGQLRLADLTHFQWDEVVIVTPYNDAKAVSKVLDHPWTYPGLAGIDIEQEELIFLHRNRVVRSMPLRSSNVFGDVGPLRMTKAQAVFICTQRPPFGFALIRA